VYAQLYRFCNKEKKERRAFAECVAASSSSSSVLRSDEIKKEAAAKLMLFVYVHGNKLIFETKNTSRWSFSLEISFIAIAARCK
jgi:hypothetical protein